MMMRVVLAATLLCWASAVSAFTGCTKPEREKITSALSNAKSLAVFAAAAVGDDEIYEKWFGKFSLEGAEVVRRTLKTVAGAIRSGTVTTKCRTIADETCQANAYAYVYGDEPYNIYLCPRFFHLPEIGSLRPGSLFSDNGTRAGTIIHELSHFDITGQTKDHCYTRRLCLAFAESDPVLAVNNADSFQYFAEDIVHFMQREDRQP